GALSEAVGPRPAAGEPEDSRHDPVAAGKTLAEPGSPDLPGRAAPHEHRVGGLARADFRAHDMRPARSAEAALPLARAVAGGGDRVALQFPPAVGKEHGALGRSRDPNSA